MMELGLIITGAAAAGQEVNNHYPDTAGSGFVRGGLIGGSIAGLVWAVHAFCHRGQFWKEEAIRMEVKEERKERGRRARSEKRKRAVRAEKGRQGELEGGSGDKAMDLDEVSESRNQGTGRETSL